MNKLAAFQPHPENSRFEQLRARHQICCPSRLAADYCDFSRAEARKIWRDNAPRKYFVGDDDDAECVGLGALMRSAQIWPPKCPRCVGSGFTYDLMAGTVLECGDCSGSGRPRDERNVFHAYLRLAIRTQVLCELKRRSTEARRRDKMGKRERSASGNFRAGRGPMREPAAEASQDETAGQELGSRVWTTSQIVPKSNAFVVDISDATGYEWLRPSDKLRRAYPKRCLQPLALWEKFVEAYKAELRRSMRTNTTEWGALLARRVIVLRCDCSSVERCHRGVLAEVLTGTRGVYEGELVLGDSESLKTIVKSVEGIPSDLDASVAYRTRNTAVIKPDRKESFSAQSRHA